MKIKKQNNNKVAIIMGSQSDYSVMKDCEKILKLFKVKYQTLIVSAHRTPKRMFQFAETAEKNGYGVIVAGAGGAAHLAGMVASLTTLPVLGVPMETKKIKGLDSLLSMAQMPKGVPVPHPVFEGHRRGEDWRRLRINSQRQRPQSLFYQLCQLLETE